MRRRRASGRVALHVDQNVDAIGGDAVFDEEVFHRIGAAAREHIKIERDGVGPIESLMGRGDHHTALRAVERDAVVQQFGGGGVERACRLIEQPQHGAVVECDARQGQAAALAGR